MSILEIKNLVKSYGSTQAVNDVSFSLNEGDNLAIVGESGCGKTTLAKLMMGLVKPNAGHIQLNASIQMVFQDPNQSLDPLWNVKGILREAFWRQSLTDAQAQQRMKLMLQEVGLSADVLGRFPHEFSGGERQRIAIARALLANPKILVLDEAVSALDSLVQRQIIELLKKLKKDFNLSYIFISHNLRVVQSFSDKILVMYKGRIVEKGLVQDILKHPTHPYTQELLQAAFFKQD